VAKYAVRCGAVTDLGVLMLLFGAKILGVQVQILLTDVAMPPIPRTQ